MVRKISGKLRVQLARELHDAPTYANQLWHARELLRKDGAAALENPHAATGRMCGCHDCFCCAALQVLREEYERVFNPRACTACGGVGRHVGDCASDPVYGN